jgi:hypothetical protein
MVLGNIIGSLIVRNNASNADGLRELAIALVATEFHILQNISLKSRIRGQPAKLLLYAVKCIDLSRLQFAANALGTSLSYVSFNCLATKLLQSSLRRCITFVYIPHLSEYLTDDICHAFIKTLHGKGIVRFYDDGLAAACRQNHHIMTNALPKSSTIYTWDYAFLQSITESNAVPRSSLAKSRWLLRTHFSMDIEAFKNILIGSTNSGYPNNPFLVMASKGLSLALIKECLNLKEMADCYYIPHYQPQKNNSYLISSTRLIRVAHLEASLLGLLETSHFSICFGITSTILYLLDAVLAHSSTYKNISANFFFCCDSNLLSAEDVYEYDDFKTAIMAYKTKNINIHILGSDFD